jgi:Flp pilus assembly protein TadD
MSLVCIQSGQPGEAKRWADVLQKLESGNADALILSAQAEMQLGNLDAAIEDINDAIKIDPHDLDLRVDLGNLYLQTNRAELARQQFEKVLQQDAKNVQALNGIATYLFTQENYTASETKLNQALRIDPDDPQTKMNLALIYSNQGKAAQAIVLYMQILDSSNTPEDWKRQAAARLKELQ